MSIPPLKYVKYEKLLHMHIYIHDYIGKYTGNVFFNMYSEDFILLLLFPFLNYLNSSYD